MVLCAGDKRVTQIDGRPASADEARDATGFGHDSDLATVVDESLRRFARAWCAAGMPHAVFETGVEELLAALPDAKVRPI